MHKVQKHLVESWERIPQDIYVRNIEPLSNCLNLQMFPIQIVFLLLDNGQNQLL